ncbi:MAG: hypothetical protein HY046_13955 [Acidobacteria bacterium]|nr:hypothetical protein [Acidobacteriota bacterium]
MFLQRVHCTRATWRRAVRIVSLTLFILIAGSAMAQADRGKPFVGNASSKKYHRTSCRSVGKMKAANRVEFSTSEEAEKAGYTPCQICLKKKSTRKSK